MLFIREKQDSQEPTYTDERLKHIDPKMIELIESEIIDKGAPIGEFVYHYWYLCIMNVFRIVSWMFYINNKKKKTHLDTIIKC